MFKLTLVATLVIMLGAAPEKNALENEGNGSDIRILDVSSTDQTRETLYKRFHAFEDLGDLLVAEPWPSDTAQCRKLNIPTQVISVPNSPGDLYLASLEGIRERDIAGAARILHTSKNTAIVFATREGAEKLKRPTGHFGLENGIRPLNMERIRPTHKFTPPPGWQQGSRAVDPKIQAMVSQVNRNNIQSVVQDLEDMGERKANSGGFTAETYLVNSFDAIGGLNVSTHHFSSSYSDNVIAELPGVVDPSVIYIVGGHYDSTSYSGLAPGADDNASGTAGVREIARILSQYEFKYTLRFIAFGAEELGLIGSDAYCDLLVQQGANVDAMINLDMTAYRAAGDPLDVDFVTNYSSSSLINFCSDMYANYVPSLGVTQGSFSGGTSDHQSFTSHGFTACFPFEDIDQYSPYIHTSNDVIGLSANDFLLAKMITQGVLAALATLASPVDLEIQHTSLSDTTDASGPYPVNAQVYSLISSNVSQVTLYYDQGSGYQAKEMVPTGSSDDYISSIPGLADAGLVRYYIEAEDDQGNTERYPDGIEADFIEFFVGYFNDIFDDDFEVNDNGWTHGGSGQDDWMRDVPTGNGGYDPGYAASGSKVWGNDLGPSGWNGNYKPNVNNWLQSPSIDCSGQTGINLHYRRWLTVEAGTYDQAKILVNGNQVFMNPLQEDMLDTQWESHGIDISAHADNNPDVRLRFTLTTDSGSEFGGWNIDDLHIGTVSSGDISALSLSEVYVEASSGGAIEHYLNGTAALGGRIYVLLLSASGTSPGTPLGSVTVPLNWDTLTGVCFNNLFSIVFQDFIGYLNPSGAATATLNVPILTDPNVIGITLYSAWFTLSPINFASNPTELLIVP